MSDEFSIGDIIRAACINPLDAIVRADGLEGPAIDEQVRAPTDNELAELEQIAFDAARVQDELRAAVGDLDKKLRGLRDQLKERLLRHGLKEVVIAGRPPIELTESNSRKPTRKSIIEVLEAAEVSKIVNPSPKALKEAKAKGKMKALNLWNAIPQSTSYGISIPDPTPPEVDSSY